jgi:hypothetical protein
VSFQDKQTAPDHFFEDFLRSARDLKMAIEIGRSFGETHKFLKCNYMIMNTHKIAVFMHVNELGRDLLDREEQQALDQNECV